jgi:hypothetical protein
MSRPPRSSLNLWSLWPFWVGVIVLSLGLSVLLYAEIDHSGRKIAALERDIEAQSKIISGNGFNIDKTGPAGKQIDSDKKKIEELKQKIEELKQGHISEATKTIKVVATSLVSVGVGVLAAAARSSIQTFSAAQALAGGPAALAVLFVWHIGTGGVDDLFQIICVSALSGLAVVQVLKMLDRYVGGHSHTGNSDNEH